MSDTQKECWICKRPIEEFSSDPSESGIELEYRRGYGDHRSYHRSCMVDAIEEGQRAENYRNRLLELSSAVGSATAFLDQLSEKERFIARMAVSMTVIKIANDPVIRIPSSDLYNITNTANELFKSKKGRS